MDPALISYLVAICATGYLGAKCLRLTNELNRLRHELEATKRQPQPSIELTEFLRDQSQYGFSFTRVDPAGVFINTPRGGR